MRLRKGDQTPSCMVGQYRDTLVDHQECHDPRDPKTQKSPETFCGTDSYDSYDLG